MDGTYCGTWWMGLQAARNPMQHVDPFRFLPALLAVTGLLFATSGVTMAISSMGRSRARVWGWAITLNLAMFLINVFGQIWPDVLGWMRPFTIHNHYQPQGMILTDQWYAQGEIWFHLAILAAFGVGGYLIAWFSFAVVICRRHCETINSPPFTAECWRDTLDDANPP